MAMEKQIPSVINAFLGIDKGEHEVNYLLTAYDPFTEDIRDETLQVTQCGRVNIAYKMEAARKTALHLQYDCIFNVEDDNVIPKNAMLRLIEAEKDFICGLYRYRPSRKPNTPLMPEKGMSRINFEAYDIDTGVQEAFLLPWGCTLFKRNVLEKITFTPGLDGDYNRKCRENGIDRWVHTDVHVGHIDIAPDGSMIEVKV